MIDPYMGILIGWKAFISAVVGGIGNVRGAMIGGFILGAVEIMVAAYLPSTYRDFVAFTLLLVLLIFRPYGILGRPQIAEGVSYALQTVKNQKLAVRHLKARWEALMNNRKVLPVLVAGRFCPLLSCASLQLDQSLYPADPDVCGHQHHHDGQPELDQWLYGRVFGGHAGFMAVGAYISALLTMNVWPANLVVWLFPLTVIISRGRDRAGWPGRIDPILPHARRLSGNRYAGVSI